jgi:hypothetical protein
VRKDSYVLIIYESLFIQFFFFFLKYLLENCR